MEILNVILKRYINFSLLELSLFFLFGLGLNYIIQIPNVISSLNLLFKQRDISSFPVNLFFTIFWFLSFLILRKILSALLSFIGSFRKYSFKSNHWPNRWEYQGNPRLGEDDNSLHITDSNSGCILKHCLWKNVEISFDCVFQEEKDGTLGIIFRAQNLSDYLMVQINNKVKKITPHIRMEGFWETIEQPEYDTLLEANVSFNVVLRTINENVKLFINGDQKLDWNIPTNSDIRSLNTNKNFTDTIVPKIDFRKSYGRIGFRAFPSESAILKNLTVKRLPNFL